MDIFPQGGPLASAPSTDLQSASSLPDGGEAEFGCASGAALNTVAEALNGLAGGALPAAFWEGQPEPSEPGASELDDYEGLEVGSIDFGTHFQEQVADLLRRAASPKRILLKDKLAFVAGVVIALLDAYWLGWSPATFYRVYSLEAAVLFTLRWVMYRMKRQHYYLFDFCYVANAVLLVHLWFFPHSALLHKITFAYATGPLAWSIVAFRNSLVFHSLDKVTSLFLHWIPACVAWTERWHPDVHVREYVRKAPEALAQWHHASVFDLVLAPLPFYLIWAMLYYVKIFVVSSKKIQQRGYETLYQYTAQNPKNPVSRLVGSVRPRLQPLVYMALHVGLTAACFAVCLIWWNHYHAHTAFLLFALIVSAWNGASFYFEIFAHRYVAALGLPPRTPARPKAE